MKSTKLFMNGRSQAVRLPADCRFEGQLVYVKKIGRTVVLIPVDNPWETMLSAIGQFSSDVFEKREQDKDQERESF
ncbi:MAG: AbrB/MazE/SpoVT family DNA-binding domain-containing protein [Oligoflexus sp.]|nr:AbrB/MazE/SpoVT family DNA-binding domain-containing protein [Oligoflexus sp.]